MRTTAHAPTALAKRWTVRIDGVPLPLSMRATTLCVLRLKSHWIFPIWHRPRPSLLSRGNTVLIDHHRIG